MIRPPPRSPLFPSTPLFRSGPAGAVQAGACTPRRFDVAGVSRLHQPARHAAMAHEQLLSADAHARDRKSTRLNSSHLVISYAVFCLKKKKIVRAVEYPVADD